MREMKIDNRQRELLENNEVVLATVNSDGSPNAIIVAELRVVEPSKVVITDNFMEISNENIKRNPRVCLVVYSKDWREGYKFTGKAEYQKEGKWAEFVKQMDANNGLPAKGAIVFEVERVYELA
jgi:predicted pyridoxine 5'-phosphate oxidase superfamily flavin-nucleotide-binding protein